MNRIIILGIGGKSTLAAHLGKQTKLPVYHLDKYYWLSNWQERDRDEMKKIVDDITGGDRWIIEGNFGMKDNWIDKRLKKADTIILLNYPFFRVVLPRMLKRRWKYHKKTRPDIAPNNKERLNWDFLKYLKNFNRSGYIEKVNNHQRAADIYIFNHPKQTNAFVKNILN